MNSTQDTLCVPLPDELRQRILDYRTALEKLLTEHAQRAADAPARLAKLEADETALSAELDRLQRSTAPDDPAAIEQLMRLETRLRMVRAQLEPALEEVASVAQPPPFWNAGDIRQLIKDLTVHWRAALLPLVTAQLRPFCADETEAENIALSTEAIQGLGRLRDSWHVNERVPARSGLGGSLNRLFDRALRGQPSLTFDPPLPDGAESPAEVQSEELPQPA